MIVLKIIKWKLPQKDDSFNVREVHVDDSGVEYYYDYSASAALDVVAILNARAVDTTPPAPPLPDEKDNQIADLTKQVVDLTKQVVDLKKAK